MTVSNMPEWLPPLMELKDFGGDWCAYFAAVYDAFNKDFVESKPIYHDRRLGLKRYPLSQGKEATFWHMISEGEQESERLPDLRRCERIRWPKPVIEHDQEPEIKVWWNERGREKRICLWFEQENYLVILADRGDYILPWTAYLIEQPHRQRKLQKEYEAWCAANAQKS